MTTATSILQGFLTQQPNLEEIARAGAQHMIAMAMEAEIRAFILISRDFYNYAITNLIK